MDVRIMFKENDEQRYLYMDGEGCSGRRVSNGV